MACKKITLWVPRGEQSIDRVLVDQADRAPIILSCYSAGERLLMLELVILMLIRKYGHIKWNSVARVTTSHLDVQRCKSLVIDRPRALASPDHLTKSLEEGRLITGWEPRRQSGVSITPKGVRFIGRASERLRSAAEKLVYTDVLERLALL